MRRMVRSLTPSNRAASALLTSLMFSLIDLPIAETSGHVRTFRYKHGVGFRPADKLRFSTPHGFLVLSADQADQVYVERRARLAPEDSRIYMLAGVPRQQLTKVRL